MAQFVVTTSVPIAPLAAIPTPVTTATECPSLGQIALALLLQDAGDAIDGASAAILHTSTLARIVDDLNHVTQVARHLEQLGCVNATGVAETERPSQHGGSSQMRLTSSYHDRFVEWIVTETVVFANEDAQQHGIARNLHGISPQACLI